VTGRWFSPDTPVSSTNKADRNDLTEIVSVESDVKHHNPNFDEHYAHDKWSIGDLLHWLNYPSIPITFPCFEYRGVNFFFSRPEYSRKIARWYDLIQF
jgi:hypothetical protein